MRGSVGIAGLSVAVASLGAAVPVSAGHEAAVLVRDSEALHEQLTTPGACAPGQDAVDCWQRDTEAEPSVAADPRDPRHAVVAFQEGRYAGGGDATNAYAVTFDAGRHWHRGVFPHLTPASGGPYARSTDPIVVFGPEGQVYATGDAVAGQAGDPSGIAVWRSDDGGRTFADPVVLDRNPGSLGVNGAVGQQYPGVLQSDKPVLAVDAGSGAGHHHGRVYAGWYRRMPASTGAVIVSYSDDGARTWATGPTGLGFVADTDVLGGPPALLVQRNGDLVMVTSTRDDVRSPDATEVVAESAFLAQYTAEVTVFAGAGSVATGQPLVPGNRVAAATMIPALDPDARTSGSVGLASVAADPASGRLVLAWEDTRARYRAGDTSLIVNDIFVSSSSDGGTTWSRPAPVTAGDLGHTHFDAVLTFASHGRLALAWRERPQGRAASVKDHASGRLTTQLAVSRNGGLSWSRPLRVDTVRSDLHFAAQTGGVAFLGDYAGIASSGDLVYVVRAEPLPLRAPAALPPTYHHQQGWVAVVRLAGP